MSAVKKEPTLRTSTLGSREKNYDKLMQLAEKSEAAGAQQRKKDREGLREIERRRNEGGKDEDEKRRRKIKDTFMTLDLQTGEPSNNKSTPVYLLVSRVIRSV